MFGAVLNSRVLTRYTDQWRGRLRACVRAKDDTASITCELTVLILSIFVIFSVTSLHVAYLTLLEVKKCLPLPEKVDFWYK